MAFVITVFRRVDSSSGCFKETVKTFSAKPVKLVPPKLSLLVMV